MEEIKINTALGKVELYEQLMPQLAALIDPNADQIANMANVCAVLKSSFGWFWVGFYRVVADQLMLGPFQGPLACTLIQKGKGVCGQAWQQGQSIVVDKVEEYPGHIACSSESKSEIVVPVFQDGQVIAVLDVDHDEYSFFDETDQKYLEQIVRLIC